MRLRRSLAHAFVTAHPLDVARELEGLSTAEIASTLAQLPRGIASRVLSALTPAIAVATVEDLDLDIAAGLIAGLPSSMGSTVLRRASSERREAVLAAMKPDAAETLRSLLRYPEGSAGALMDPRSLALPLDLKVAEALATMRKEADGVTYNLYVLDREQTLVGVLNLHELLSARSSDRLEQIAKPATHRLSVLAGYRSIIDHPGWRLVHSLPVVDSEGRYLGALRYRTFRRLESLSRIAETGNEAITARALGDLFWAGIEGVIDTLVLASMRRLDRQEGGSDPAVFPPDSAQKQPSGSPADGSAETRDSE